MLKPVCLSKADFTAGTCLWCLITLLSPWLAMNVLSNYARVLDNSGPATIQRANVLRLSVRPIAYHGPFTKLLYCSYAWSIDMSDDTLGVFRITTNHRRSGSIRLVNESATCQKLSPI